MIKVQPAVKSRFPFICASRSWGEGATCGVWDDRNDFRANQRLETGSFLTLNREWGVNPAD